MDLRPNPNQKTIGLMIERTQGLIAKKFLDIKKERRNQKSEKQWQSLSSFYIPGSRN